MIALPEFSEIITFVLKQRAEYEYVFGSIIENILSDLIESGDYLLTRKRFEASGIEMPKKMKCAVIIPKKGMNLGTDYIKKIVNEELPDSYYVTQSGLLWLLVPENSEKMEIIEEICRHDAVKQIGIGPAASDVEDYLYGWEKAAGICRIADMLKKEEKLCRYDEYKLYELLLDCSDDRLLKNNIHPAVGILRKYDVENESDLFGTLKCYLENDCCNTETAEKLFIHRNTQTYRLGKIKEYTEIDFGNGEEKFRLYLSFKILDILKNRRRK